MYSHTVDFLSIVKLLIFYQIPFTPGVVSVQNASKSHAFKDKIQVFNKLKITMTIKMNFKENNRYDSMRLFFCVHKTYV